MAQTQGFDRVVTNMMSRYGGDAYLISASTYTGVYDPATSSYTTGAPRTYKVSAIFMDFPLRKDGVRDMSDSLVDDFDKQVFIKPYKDTPLPAISPNKDFIRVGNTIWKIVGMKEENPTLTDSIVIILYIKK